MKSRVVLLVLAALALAACDPPVPDSGRWVAPVFPVTATKDVVYKTTPDENGVQQQLHLDLYEPSGDAVARRPAIVWVHGGGFRNGDRTNMADISTRFAKRGYVTVTIEYRLRDSNIGQAILDAKHDAQDAVRWLRANADRYNVDPARIAIGGYSAGAITALNVAYADDDAASRVGAAISLSGTATYPGAIGAGDPPVRLFHGTADPIVRFANAESTCATAQRAGLVCELRPFPGVGHNLYAEDRRDVITDEIASFLFRKLRPAT